MSLLIGVSDASNEALKTLARQWLAKPNKIPDDWEGKETISLSPGWNEITWPDVSGKKALDVPIECPTVVAREKFWFIPYVKDFGGINFNFKKDKTYYLKCNQKATWRL